MIADAAAKCLLLVREVEFIVTGKVAGNALAESGYLFGRSARGRANVIICALWDIKLGRICRCYYETCIFEHRQ